MKRIVMYTEKKSVFFENIFFETTETFIHPTSFVGPSVQLGSNVKIGPYVTIVGNVCIDDNTRLYGHSMIGMPAEDRSTTRPQGTVVIGKNVHIREFVSINASKYVDGMTRIGDDCYIMNFCYVSHDATLENNVTLINSVNLGGHAYIEHHATLMANSAIHQFCRVGAYSALSAFSATGQDIPPFCMMDGAPAAFAGLNRVGLKRNDFSQESIEQIKKVTRLFFQDKKSIVEIQKEIHDLGFDSSVFIKQFLTFIEKSSRGVTRKIRDQLR
jgi:UDP-N-acetylglucosamine acyltransferase